MTTFCLGGIRLNRILILLLVTASSISAQAQVCTQDITLSSQAEVDAFSSTYGCTEIDGLLTIRGNDITNLAGLASLQVSRGRLMVIANPLLTNLDGLSNLTSVEQLAISNNAVLANIQGLAGLTSVSGPGHLEISNNPVLANLDGLNNVTSVSGNLIIDGNATLNNLEGLSSVTWIGHLFLSGNASLPSLDGLSSLTEIGGGVACERCLRSGLLIDNNSLLQQVDALSSLATIDDNLTITGNASLSNLDGLSGLTSVGQMVEIANNASLTNLNGLSNLSSIGFWFPSFQSVFISGNPSLTSILGLSQITSLEGEIHIDNNDALRNLDGLESLTTIDGRRGSFTITGNEVLENLDGARSLTSVSGFVSFVTITDNPALLNLNGLASLTRIGSGFSANLVIRNNAVLGNIDSLSSLVTITSAGNSYLTLVDNPNLTRGCGLYPLLSTTPSCSSPGLYCINMTISGNGAGVTLEGIIAQGPCGDGSENPNQPLSLVFSAVTGNSMRLSFTAPLQPVEGYLTLIRAFGFPSPDESPVDGVRYIPGNVIGQSTIVAGVGPDRFVEVVSLLPNITYYVEVYSWTTIGGSIVYSQDPLTGTQRTLDQAITQPTELRFTDVTHNSMTLLFTPPETPPAGYVVLMRALSAPSPEDVPVNGSIYQVGNTLGTSTIVVGSGPQTTLNIIHLLPNLEYFFDVFSYHSTAAGLVYQATAPLEGSQATQSGFIASLNARTQAYPNPFKDEVFIPFHTRGKRAAVQVTIYDQMANPIVELVNDNFEPGNHQVRWDGKDRSGASVMSGTYIYRLTVHGDPNTVTGRLVVE